MKKSSGANQNGGNRYSGVYTSGHRHNPSASVGNTAKQRGSANAEGTNNASERTGYHQGGGQIQKQNPFKQATGTNGTNSSSTMQEKLCDSCKYRTPANQCTTFRCRDCGIYTICEYCYEEYMEKGSYYDTKKIQCVYCWSRHTLTDICVKTLKSLGFMPIKGSNKIQIQNLTREKIKKLSNLRVIQKTLVYVIGIAPEIASEEKLKSVEYFGQYGNLNKVVVNTKDVYNATRGGPSYSAYLTFQSPRESAIAILSVDQYVLNDRMIRASFGTSKFCQFFLNNQKCNNKDCLYLHELRADLEAYTKEDMQNNKFIFLEQQKIAIKLSKALELSKEQFNKYNLERNEQLRTATERAKQSGVALRSILPEPSYIYHKDFHFLDEPLIERQHQREAAAYAKATPAKSNSAAANQNNDVNSASTAATNATSNSSNQTNQASSSQITTSKQSTNKLTTKPLKAATDTTEESKQSSVMPIFTNMKDVVNQPRKQSQLRAPLSKAMLTGSHSTAAADSSSAKNSCQSATSQTYNSTQQNNNTSIEGRQNDAGSGAQSQVGGAQGGTSATASQQKNVLFPFEPFCKQLGAESKAGKETGTACEGGTSNVGGPESAGEHMNILTKQSNQSSAAIFQNLQLANQAAEREKISLASAAAAERFRKKEKKNKKKIVVEPREQVVAPVVEANIKKVDKVHLATITSPVKLGGPSNTSTSTGALIPEESKEPLGGISRPLTDASQINTKRHTSPHGLIDPYSINGKNTPVTMGAATNSKQNGTSSQPWAIKYATVQGSSSAVNLANNRAESSSSSLLVPKEKQSLAEVTKATKQQSLNNAQTVSLGTLKKFGGSGSDDEERSDEMSPALQYSRNQSRFQFAHSVDPIKKGEPFSFKFGFGCGGGATTSDTDKDEILVPMKVQEIIHRSIRTLSNSISERSPEQVTFGQRIRDGSYPLVPVEEIEAELEQRWYTLEEQFQEGMMMQREVAEETKDGPVPQTTNPFRKIHKKQEKEPQVVASNLDVKRVKYQYKQTSPAGDEKQQMHSPELDEYNNKGKDGASGANRPVTSPFYPAQNVSNGKEAMRSGKGGRRGGPQADRTRQPPMNR